MGKRKKMMEKENIILLHNIFQLIHLQTLKPKLQKYNDLQNSNKDY